MKKSCVKGKKENLVNEERKSKGECISVLGLIYIDPMNKTTPNLSCHSHVILPDTHSLFTMQKIWSIIQTE